jgi:Ca-activated chloride channel family protein
MKGYLSKIFVLVVIVIAPATNPPLLAADRSKIKDGIESFQKEQWDESLNKFQDALLDDPTNPLLHFNVGDALYKKQNYEEALKSFEKTLNTNDVSLQEKAYYNMGNNYYQMNKYQEAIDYYKKALELDPEDVDAKYNLELVRAKIKEMAKKQPMNNQQQSQQQQQGEQQQQQQQQGSNDQQQNEQQQAGENQENKDQQNQQQQQQQKAQAEQQKEQEQQVGEQKEKKELTKEEAEQILRALRSKEESNKKLRPMPKQSGRVKVEKDW